MSLVSPVFEQHYKAYLHQLADLDFNCLAPETGGRASAGPGGQVLEIPYFNRPLSISSRGIRDGSGRKPGYDTCIILCRYLIMAGEGRGNSGTGSGYWSGFRDLKDSGPLTVYFRDNVETAIARTLAGKFPVSPESLDILAPSPFDSGLQYDLVLRVEALPKVPMLVLVNDAEDGFPASCSVLFEPDVELFLDAECIAMAGFRLAQIMKQIFS